MPNQGRSTPIDTLFNSNGEVKYRIKKSSFFTRPAYQYTHAEVGKIDYTNEDNFLDSKS